MSSASTNAVGVLLTIYYVHISHTLHYIYIAIQKADSSRQPILTTGIPTAGASYL